jgi:hypothetical protein
MQALSKADCNCNCYILVLLLNVLAKDSYYKKERWHSSKSERSLYSPAVKVNVCNTILIKGWRLNAILCFKYTIKFRIVSNLPNPFRVVTRNPMRGYSGYNHKASSHNLYLPILYPRNSGLEVPRWFLYYYLCS